MSPSRQGDVDDVGLRLRPPRLSDAARIWSLVPEIGLEVNSCYAYLLLCSHFADSAIVAESGGEPGELVGFVLGYRPPTAPDELFVWQVGVVARMRGTGLAGRMLAELVARARARFVSATVSPDNAASLALFRGLARRAGAPCRAATWFPSALFATPHPDEDLLKIGPLP